MGTRTLGRRQSYESAIAYRGLGVPVVHSWRFPDRGPHAQVFQIVRDSAKSTPAWWSASVRYRQRILLWRSVDSECLGRMYVSIPAMEVASLGPASSLICSWCTWPGADSPLW